MNFSYIAMDCCIKKFSDDPFSGKIVTIDKGDAGDYVSSKETWRNGRKDGLSTRWFSNGIKMYERNYNEGKWHGTITRWWPNGQKMYVRAYTNGERHGKEATWRSDGTPINSTTVSSQSGESSDPGSDSNIDPSGGLDSELPSVFVPTESTVDSSIESTDSPQNAFPVLDSGPAVPSPEPVVNETIPAFEPLGGSDPVVPLTPAPEVPSDLSSPSGLPPLEGDSTTSSALPPMTAELPPSDSTPPSPSPDSFPSLPGTPSDGGLPPPSGDSGLPPLPGDGGLPPPSGDGGLPPLPGDGGLPPLPGMVDCLLFRRRWIASSSRRRWIASSSGEWRASPFTSSIITLLAEC